MLKSLEVALRLNLAGFSGKLGAASAQVQQFGANVKRAGADAAKGITEAPARNVEKVGHASLIAGGLVAAGIGMAVRATMDFDARLSDLQAATSASADEMGRFRDQSLEAGAATAFSASEAAQAQVELAKAGMATSDILGGGLTGALNLAAAGNLDLATAANISANAMTVFGLKGEDMAHVADVIAAGGEKSAATVELIAQSLQQTGLVADQFGLSMEDTVGTLAAFHQAGLKGSDAGTSMKTMLSSFIPKSAEAAETMEQLGLRFFNARGEFVGIEAAAEQLRTKLSGLSQEQRMAALQTIFGADAIRAATILYEQGGEGIGDWVSNVNDSGFAADVAATKMDNLAGDLEALRGSIETALIEGGSKATGALRFLVQGATGAVNAFSGMPGPVQTGVMALGSLAGAALLTVGAVGSMVPKVQAGMAALTGMGTAGQFAASGLRMVGTASMALGKVGLIAAGLYAVREALVAIGEDADNVDVARLQRDLLDTADAGRIVGDELESAMGKARDALDDVSMRDFNERGTFDELRNAIDGIDEALARLASRDPSAARQAFREVREELESMGVPAEVVTRSMDTYQAAMAEAEVTSRTTASAMEEMGPAGSTAAAGIGEVGDEADDAQAQIDEFQDTLDNLLGRFQSVPDAVDQVQSALHEIAAQFEESGSRIDGNSEAAIANREALRGLVSDQYDLIAAMQAQGASAPALQLAQAQAIQQIQTLGERYGWSEEQVRQYTDQILAIPTEAGTEITVDDEAATVALTNAAGNLDAWNASRGTATADANNTPAQQRINEALARLFGWDGSSGTADAFLADLASTPLGAVQLQLARYNASSGTADANVNANRGPLDSLVADLNALDGRYVTATARINFQVYGQQEYNRARALMPNSRWGNITDAAGRVVHAQSGYWWDEAGIATQPTMFWGERETGGEAFIPRIGDSARARKILGVAAGWHGMALVPKDMLAAQAGLLLGSAASSRSTPVDLARGFAGVEKAIHLGADRQIAAARGYHHHLLSWMNGNVTSWLRLIKGEVDVTENATSALAKMFFRIHAKPGWKMWEDMSARVPGLAFAEGGIGRARPGGLLGRFAEAGSDEAIIPLNQFGVSVLEEAMRRYASAPPAAPAAGGTAQTLNNTVNVSVRAEAGVDQAGLARAIRDEVTAGLDKWSRDLRMELATGSRR